MDDVVDIGELDVDDERALREFFDVDEAAFRADHPHAVLRTFPQLVQMSRRPSPYYRRTLVVARHEGRIVGTADLGLTLEDNLHLAQLQVRVHPDVRRQGIGRALHEELERRARDAGRTTFLVELNQPLEGAGSPAYLFARTLGYSVVHEQDHLLLSLPIEAGHLAALPAAAPGYTVLTWKNHAPEDVVEAYAAMRTQMGRDAPAGEGDHQPVEITVERVRESERRTIEAYDSLVAVARRDSDGVLGGYSLVYLAHDADHVIQDDTLVMPEHRGRGLGLALKAAVLRLLGSEHPERSVVHTWNAVENEFMQRINRELGFRPVDRELEMQLKVARA